jgi:carboxylesterase
LVEDYGGSRREVQHGRITRRRAFYFEGSHTGCLLIHGFTGTPQNLRPLGDFLARRGITVLAPRLAGHGTSVDEFEETGSADWIASVEVGLDQLKRTCSDVFAIGISMGGTLALHLAARHGGDLAGVGCINGPVGALPAFDAAAQAIPAGGRMPAPWAGDARLLTKDLASAGITYGEIPKSCLQQALAFFRATEGEIGQIRVPTCLFFSRDDAVVPPSTRQRLLELLTAAPDKRLVDLTESAHEATLDFDVERIGLEWLSFVRQHLRAPVAA